MMVVMAGHVPAIHVFGAKNVDARHKAGHDGKRIS
jgi:DNA replication and repair protein RecF